MTAYLDSLQPKIYLDRTPRMLSALEFASVLARALVSVGMQPVRSAWTFDITDAASIPTLEIADNDNASYQFPFDYPSVDTFTVNGTTYRPYMTLVVRLKNPSSWNYQYNYFSQCSCVALVPGVRRPGPYTISNKVLLNQLLNSGIVGSTGDGGSYVNQAFDRMEGCWFGNWNWRPYQTFPVHRDADEDYYTMNLRQLFVYLGPAGLFVQAGSGLDRSNVANFLNVGFMAHGGRIPNRQYLVSYDPNLSRINPVMPLFMKETDATVWSSSQLKGIIQGMQYNLKATTGMVYASLFNLENLDWPIWPTYWPYTAPSPREIENQNVHVLARPVIVPLYAYGDVTNDYGPIVPELEDDDTRPKWEQVFSSHGFRFGDRTAPMGLYEDPLTNIDWYMIPQYNTGGMVGLMAENAILTDQLSAPVLQPYLTPIPIPIYTGFAGAQTVDVAIDRAANGSTSPVTLYVRDWWTGSTAFNTMTATSEFTRDTPNSNVAYDPKSEITFSIIPPPTDPLDTIYEVTFDHRYRGTHTNQLNQQYVDIEIMQRGAWTLVKRVLCPGVTESSAQWEYTPQSIMKIPRDPSVDNAPLRVRFRMVAQAGNPGATYEAKSLTVNRYRYL